MSARPVPPADPGLVERPGRALPGSVALVAAAAGLVGCGAAAWWAGALPVPVTRALHLPPYGAARVGPVQWAALAAAEAFLLCALAGLRRGRVGGAWVLSRFGRYKGSVRRTGLVWMNPLTARRQVDVRLRHWRSGPMPVVDADGIALRVVVLVVWRIEDTARAAFSVADHEAYLTEQVEAALAGVVSRLPADAFDEDAPTLRDTEAVGDALTRRLAEDTAAVGIEVFSAQPVRIEYAPELAAAMRDRRIAVLDARRRDSVLGSVVDAVDDTVTRLTERRLVEFDDYERKALVRDLTVAFCRGRAE